ncbi:MAG TPA: DUF3102 domain-containing protein [Devosia sp.]|jgi:hypothetical protein|uniref:DUF3102 domain-containing protein n=1 Tax=Devosia sp. TaxID=1871048 RepID=UPI002DDD6594|nr:DUF3102 domain-containing protein [Devosia sp.]HEV2517918.1 DUF3102 domain-containing protein [Devosia sp.]
MTTSNIAGAINDAHANVEKAKRQAVVFAIECGKLLEQAKATVPHGSWKPWLAEHCTFSERTAQLYMKVAKHVGHDPAKAQRVADLSLRELAVLMAKPSRDEREAGDLLAVWYGTENASRIQFAAELLERGDIDLRTYRTLCAAAGMTAELAAGRAAEWLAAHIPPERHQEFIANLGKADTVEVARELGAILGRRTNA